MRTNDSRKNYIYLAEIRRCPEIHRCVEINQLLHKNENIRIEDKLFKININ